MYCVLRQLISVKNLFYATKYMLWILEIFGPTALTYLNYAAGSKLYIRISLKGVSPIRV